MDKTQRTQALKEQQAAALVKLDRSLEELERYGQERVRDKIETVADELDLPSLKSIVYDVEDALQKYAESTREIKRIG